MHNLLKLVFLVLAACLAQTSLATAMSANDSSKSAELAHDLGGMSGCER